MTETLRVGVLADPYLREWQVRSLERVRADPTVDLSLVLVDEDAATDPEQATIAKATTTAGVATGLEALSLFRSTLARERAWTLVLAERELAERLGESRPLSARRHVSAVDIFDDAEIQYVTPEYDGAWAELPSSAVRTIRTRCDVIVRYGFGLIRGEVLNAPAHGVVSFHPADIRRYRGLGVPMAYFDGREVIGVTLQRLTDDIDAGEIVAEATIPIDGKDTLWDVYDRVYAHQINLLAEGLRAIRDPDAEPTVPDELGPYYSMDRRRRLGFALRTLLRNVRRRLS